MGIPTGLNVSPARPLDLIPPPAPLAMPVQDLDGRRRCREPRSAGRLAWRRTAVIGAALGTAAFTFWGVCDILGADGLGPIEVATAGLSAGLSAWVAFGFVAALAGFFIAWTAPRPSRDVRFVSARTAILMPVYNENPTRVLAALQAMAEDLARLGAERLFDIFVLSDTRDAAVARAEAAGVLRLRLKLGDGVAIYYRRRQDNAERKAGNVADWVRRWGGAYAHMLVLDADSIMSGETIVDMAAAMEADPKLGLLQSAPMIVAAETPFARLQQFAAWLYGPIFALGQDWWSGDEGNYWGHNAIIRVRAFAASAGLPSLPGRRPFGGHIQSHDFVEAALLRRDGWKVRMDPTLTGSYEEAPPTLIDAAIRDRRWCQGNLQHARLLRAGGLHWVSRLHLLRGVMSYLTAPMWLALLACGSLVWPSLRATPDAELRLTALFSLTMVMLMAPKVLAVLLTLRDRRHHVLFGGRTRLIAGAMFETALSIVIAPIQMLMQATAVVEVLAGHDSGWGAQARDGGDTCARHTWRVHRLHVALGVVGAVAAAAIDQNLFLWTSPVFLGLSLSSLVSLHTANGRFGLAMRRWGLLQTPDETRPDAVLARTQQLRGAFADETTYRWVDGMFRVSTPLYRASDMAGVASLARAAA